MSIPGERFYKMSNAVFCYGLTPIQLSAYSYLVCCAGQKDRCWPSIKTIAACCGCSETSARAAVKVLDERGFIRKVDTYSEYRGERRQTNNTYYILDFPSLRAEPKAEIIEDEDTDKERRFA